MFRAYLGCLMFGWTVTAVLADVPTAEKYIAEAKKKLGEDKSAYSLEDVRKKLDLAELELEGVGADAKKPVAAAIAAVRKEVGTLEAATNAKTFQRDLKRFLSDAESAAGNLVTWPGVQGRFEEFAKKPGVAEALGDDLKDAQKRFESMAKLYTKNKQEETVRGVESLVKDLETSWAERKGDASATDRPEARNRAVENTTRDADRLTKSLKELPDDHPTRKAAEPRVQKVLAELRTVSQTGAAGEVVRRLKDSWELDARETTGWEGETADVTFERYSKESSQKMSAFGAPKTVELIKVAGPWLKNRETDAAYQEAKGDAGVKAIYEGVKQSREKALARIEAAAETIVGQAEKTPITEQNLNAFERLTGDLRVSLGDSAKSAPLQARVQKVIDQRAANAAGAEKARDEWYATMTQQAAKKWPDLKAKYTTASGFDPQSPSGSKGKLFATTTDNLMGYRFKPGDFPFATTINGRAVAAKYDPAVAGAIEEVQKKLGRDLGDNDNDGKWEIVYRVEGTTGKLMARKQVEGDLTLDGQKVGTYRGEYSEPTDAAIVTIVAAKCGPLAVSSEGGMVTESGETKVVTGSGSTTSTGGWTGYGWLGSIPRFLIGVAAALLALLYAGWKPLTNIPAVQTNFEKLSTPLVAVGAIAVLFGLYWLFGDLFRGFAAALCLIATGAFIGVMGLSRIGVVPATLADKVRPYGVALGFACLAATLVSLITQGRLWVI